MSAPMNTLLFASYFRFSLARHYSRRVRRHVGAVIAPHEEIERLSGAQVKKIINPKKNPYSPFNPDDPIQGSLVKSVSAMQEKVRKQSKLIDKHANTDTKSDINRVNKKDDVKRTNKENFKVEVNKGARISEVIKTSNISAAKTLDYSWMEKNDPQIGKLMLKCSSRKYRNLHQEVIVEGLLGLKNALTGGAKLKSIFLSGNAMLQTVKAELGDSLEQDGTQVPIFMIPYKGMKRVASEEQPEGILGIFEKPDDVTQNSRKCLPLTLVCGQIQSPIQLGQLLQQAWVLGCQKVIISKGSADVWSNKVLRIGGCVQFRLPIYQGVPWSKIASLLPDDENVKVYATHQSCTEKDIANNILGSPDAAEKIESFNALEMYEEDALEPSIDEDENVNDDNNDDDEDDGDHLEYKEAIDKLLEHDREKVRKFLDNNDNKKERFLKTKLSKVEQMIEDLPEDLAFKSPETLKVYRDAPLPVARCDSIDLSGYKHVVLIVSDYSPDMVPEVRKLVYDRYGEYLALPGDVSGLHKTFGTSVLLYEISKHLRQLNKFSVDSEEQED